MSNLNSEGKKTLLEEHLREQSLARWRQALVGVSRETLLRLSCSGNERARAVAQELLDAESHLNDQRQEKTN